MDFRDAAGALAGDLTTLRRRLHAHPEVGLDLPETQAVLREALDGLPLEITAGERLTSLTAVLRGGRPGPVVLLRADMDGLPITEATGLDFAAPTGAYGAGTMHACGHDLHMAGLVGAARLLAARRDELPGTVVFMFQPGEEGFAGARVMLEEGVLDAAGAPPVAAYALHVDSVLASGVVTTRPGAIMASATGLKVRIVGTGGHAAYPHLGVDPIPVAAELVLALQTFVTRRVPAVDPAVVSVTRLTSDSAAPNVLDLGRSGGQHPHALPGDARPRPGRARRPHPGHRRGARRHRAPGVHRLLPGRLQRPRGDRGGARHPRRAVRG